MERKIFSFKAGNHISDEIGCRRGVGLSGLSGHQVNTSDRHNYLCNYGARVKVTSGISETSIAARARSESVGRSCGAAKEFEKSIGEGKSLGTEFGSEG